MFKNSKLMTLFFTMVVVMIGFGLIIPIMPFYVQKFGAGGAELGLIMSVFSIMQFIASPFWGNLSDRFGRKSILMAGVLGNAVTLVLSGLAGSFWMLFAARALSGLLSSATLPTAMAYIGDSTTQEERGGGMGVIGAAMGVGMVIGPGLGGLVTGDNLSLPFFLAAGMSMLALLLIWLVLPESLPAEKRTGSTTRVRGIQPALLVKALVGPAGFVLFLAFLVNFALASFEGVFGLFAGARYGYGPQQVGSVLMVIGLVSALVQMLLTGPATKKLGEAALIKLSLVASAVGFVLMVLAEGNFWILLTVGVFVFSNAMLRPAIMALNSRISREGQGITRGLNNSFQSLGRVIGPLWAGLLFDFSVNLPYLSGAVIMVIIFFYSLWKMNPEQIRVALNQQPVNLSIPASED